MVTLLFRCWLKKNMSSNLITCVLYITSTCKIFMDHGMRIIIVSFFSFFGFCIILALLISNNRQKPCN